MIVYSVQGKYPNCYNKFIEACLNHLIPTAPEHDVNVLINIKKRLKSGNVGQCIGDCSEITIELARFYEDGIALTKDELAANLAHELVHAKQYIFDEINAVDYTWKSNDYSECDYWDQPWEVEAYHREKVLTKKYWSNQCTK